MVNTLIQIELGTILNSNAAIYMLRRLGFMVGDWAEDMLRQPTFKWSSRTFCLNIVEASGAELGFKQKMSYGAVCESFVKKGYALCPPEIGPQLRLQYRVQPANNWLMLAMPPVLDSVGYQSIFFLGRGSGGLWLGASRGHPDVMLSPSTRFVACRP